MNLRSDKPELQYESDIERACKKLKKEAKEIRDKLKMTEEAREREYNERLAAAKIEWAREAEEQRVAEEMNRTCLESITPQFCENHGIVYTRITGNQTFKIDGAVIASLKENQYSR